MTPKELEEIRARCEAATPGPWVVNWKSYDYQDERYERDEGFASILTLIKERDLEIACQTDIPQDRAKIHCEFPDNKADFEKFDRANFELMANARTDIPRLLDYIDHIHGSMITLKERLDQAKRGQG